MYSWQKCLLLARRGQIMIQQPSVFGRVMKTVREHLCMFQGDLTKELGVSVVTAIVGIVVNLKHKNWQKPVGFFLFNTK